MTVFLIIRAVSEDYHGTEIEVLEVTKNRQKAEHIVKKLQDKNQDYYNTEFYFQAFLVT